MLAAMEHLVRTGSDLNKLDSQGAAPLHIAAACGYLDVVGFLLQHGANIDLPDRDGWMAIHVAACWGQYEVIEMLTNFGAKLDTPTVNGGETVFDICEDEKLHERLVILREELKRWQNFHLAQSKNSTANGNGDLNSKNRGLSRRRSSNPRSSSIRRTSMRDKAKISWKEAQQEAETCSLVVPAADGDSVVEEVVKTPVWMTAVEESNGGGASSSAFRKNSPPEAIAIPSSVNIHQRRPTGPSLLTPFPANSNARSRPSNNLRDPTITVPDGPRLLLSHKSDSLARKRTPSNDSPPQRNRLTNRPGDLTPPNLTSNGSQPSAHTPPAPPPHQQASVNGVSSSNVLLHNAYYPVNFQTTSSTVSASSNVAGTKKWSQARAPPPSHVLISTGAKPKACGTSGVIASPLQPGASLTRPPLKRELLISGDQGNGNNTSGKCCTVM
ncbi:unnamed protein product [Hymenolepis diminuta]|nr:unnamed protein product [Hymenolepis diminuta]